MGLCYLVFATLPPHHSTKLPALALDLIADSHHLYVSLANGNILQLSHQGKIEKTYKLPPLKTPYGDSQPQKALCIAVYGNTLGVAGNSGEITLFTPQTSKTLTYKTPSVIRKLSFINEKLLLITLLSNEVILYDISTQRMIYSKNYGTWSLSDASYIAPYLYITGEAGTIVKIDPLSGKSIQIFTGGNVDNIFKISAQSHFIATAGQDRRSIIYTLQGLLVNRFDSPFLIYAVGLSPSSQTIALSWGENNEIALFSTATKKLLATYQGHSASLNRILFLDEHHFVSIADENKILFWEKK